MTNLDRLRASVTAESLEAYRAEIDRLRARLAVVDDFCAERAQYVTALKQNTDGGADYHRWQGHAEARRQLSERLGLPTAWPDEPVAVPVEPKETK